MIESLKSFTLKITNVVVRQSEKVNSLFIFSTLKKAGVGDDIWTVPPLFFFFSRTLFKQTFFFLEISSLLFFPTPDKFIFLFLIFNITTTTKKYCFLFIFVREKVSASKTGQEEVYYYYYYYNAKNNKNNFSFRRSETWTVFIYLFFLTKNIKLFGF